MKHQELENIKNMYKQTDTETIEELLKFRDQKAKLSDVSPYLILSDFQIQDLTYKKPFSVEKLLECLEQPLTPECQEYAKDLLKLFHQEY